MNRSSKIGVVTVTYNSGTFLAPFYRSILSQTHRNFILYAVDNASSDDTAALLGEVSDPRIRCILNPTNVGVAEGNNQGIRAALRDGCDLVLLLNNDTEFGPDLFSLLLDGIAQHNVDMCCPKMMYFDAPQRIWSAGGSFQPWLGYRSSHIGEDEEDRGQYDHPRLVTYVPTCCVLIKREVFDRIGLMDATYFVYSDDTDFMYRAMKADVRLLYLPTAKLLHKVGSCTGGEQSPFAIRFCTRNRVYFMLKHLGALRTTFFLAMYQMHFLIGAMTSLSARKALLLRERATIEGIRMWRDQAHFQGDDGLS